MQELDTEINGELENHHDEEELFMQHVVGDDHELLFLDTYLKEMFSK